jgi:hypothetical protein
VDKEYRQRVLDRRHDMLNKLANEVAWTTFESKTLSDGSGTLHEFEAKNGKTASVTIPYGAGGVRERLRHMVHTCAGG